MSKEEETYVRLAEKATLYQVKIAIIGDLEVVINGQKAKAKYQIIYLVAGAKEMTSIMISLPELKAMGIISRRFFSRLKR